MTEKNRFYRFSLVAWFFATFMNNNVFDTQNIFTVSSFMLMVDVLLLLIS